MNPIFVVIVAGERSTEAVLAAEALRHAASAHGAVLHAEVRTPQGVIAPLDLAAAGSAYPLLLVGDGDADEARFAGAAPLRVSLDAVLDDAAGALAPLLAAADAAPTTTASAATQTDAPKRIVAVTSCPTGIAHTFMAAEGLQQAAKTLGYQIRVETQGSVGAQDTLSAAEIADADLVLIAADREVDLSRFGGKRLFKSGTKPAINDGPALIRKALAEAGVHAASGNGATPASSERGTSAGPYKHLMTGVSFMLPFVTAGGLLIALAFALGGIYAFDDAHKGTLAWSLFQIGAKAGFTLMVPALAGYIAYSIADRPGIAPGMIGGMVAANLGAGFIGGIFAGFIAGYGVAALNRAIKLPRTLEGLKPVLILPVLGTLLVGLTMLYVVGQPVAEALAWLTDWLRGMQGSSAVLLGLLLGAMMAFDMGGPVNKAAYAFSTGLIASQVYTPMAAAMVAGMTPPLGIALATWVFRNRFTREERGTSAATGVLGLAFVTEGAIPYAARDPLRTIPALMLGSALAGAISMAAGAELKVPHGGVFVLPIPNAVTNLGMYLIALLAGTVLTAVALRVLKKPIAE
ncbi:PTS fructose transporter subunit IIC [Xanthomonas translucens]|uniref:protein-N(pi)-phosphohistidine--D-fructose phosphotransferase n=5 Tax=Xanthomonas campestris pv. translucens TaxID=343 RepID=A0A109HI81_XANCT|nr:fructose-specific PTS transporter subunit EIIC [Xanthomonas translucens]KWV12718.1 PTS fructose transporter subunit IIBC [Xanthomonas translucens]MCT8285313.1 fructose-specific PTS transporter subunit EIIC [Xanthomonas translucens pv. translucens]MCT8302971.1 fructose-specific PTS transporter subunit EIIC [Xanthomonas translucens pv. translucens]QSQ29337.1 PTS fructose transporter subunit EIIBC [Xanthomonas translucens pv. translucens]QSQ35443.1 PTS fructose transporter subunit EIIBC [Xanth